MSKINYLAFGQEIAHSVQLIRATIGPTDSLFSGVYPDLRLWQQIK